MRIINTAEVTPDAIPSQWERDQVYNGLDCCVTSEVLDVLLPQLDNHTAATYRFSKELQGPALEMRLRGVRVDLVMEVFYDFGFSSKINSYSPQSHLKCRSLEFLGEPIGCGCMIIQLWKKDIENLRCNTKIG